MTKTEYPQRKDDTQMNRKVRWGVLGTAGIAAGCTIPGMKAAEGCELYAIAGRNINKALSFKERFGFEKAYEGYDALLADPDDENRFGKVREAWETMEELYDRGRIKAIGLSNFLPHHIRPLLETARIRPMVDQLELHVGYMQEYTLAYLKREGILPQAWSPLGRAKLLQDERISAAAAKYGCTPAQLLLGYLIRRGIPVIPKSSSPERMRENLDVCDIPISADDMSYLSCIPETGWSGEHPDEQ